MNLKSFDTVFLQTRQCLSESECIISHGNIFKNLYLKSLVNVSTIAPGLSVISLCTASESSMVRLEIDGPLG